MNLYPHRNTQVQDHQIGTSNGLVCFGNTLLFLPNTVDSTCALVKGPSNSNCDIGGLSQQGSKLGKPFCLTLGFGRVGSMYQLFIVTMHMIIMIDENVITSYGIFVILSLFWWRSFLRSVHWLDDWWFLRKISCKQKLVVVEFGYICIWWFDIYLFGMRILFRVVNMGF